MKIHLLIADDHAIVREGLKKIFDLTSDIHVTAEANNAFEVTELLHSSKRLDLILLDLIMPGASGTDLISQIHAIRNGLPTLIFSMHNDPHVAFRTLKAGANGYVAKDCNPEVLLEAIRRVAAGGNYIDPILGEQLLYETVFSEQNAPHKLLSEREYEVFRLLVSGNHVNAIAKKLDISNKTVSTHKLNLMEKMKMRSIAELVRYALQHNLIH